MRGALAPSEKPHGHEAKRVELLTLAAIRFWSAVGRLLSGKEGDSEVLASAMKIAKAILQDGLGAREAHGTSISAEFEIEDENCNCRSIR